MRVKLFTKTFNGNIINQLTATFNKVFFVVNTFSYDLVDDG